MTATRAEYTKALHVSNAAFKDFETHLRNCPACWPVRTDCPTRKGLYENAARLRQVVDDIVAGWSRARRDAAQAAPEPTRADAEQRDGAGTTTKET